MDWKAPELTLVDEYEVEYGQSVSMYQLIEQARDSSDFTLSLGGEGEVNEDKTALTFAKPGKYTAEVTAKDVHGNSVTKRVTVHVVDRTPPVVSGENFSVYLGETVDYQDKYSASDEIDGDLTQSVTIDDSMVDTSHAGHYEVTYTATDSSGNQGSTTVILSVEQEPASFLSLSRGEVYLAGNEYEQLTTYVEPSDWAGSIVWTSSDPDVAMVNDGLITWTGVGDCVITAQADDVTAECVVYCEPVRASDVWISKHTMKLKDGESQTLTVTQTLPSNWSGDVSWSSSNPAVATVEDGVVTWVGGGTCTITATADSVSDSCTVTCEARTTLIDIIGGWFGGQKDDSASTSTDNNTNTATNDFNSTAAQNNSSGDGNHENNHDNDDHKGGDN
jgi:hypothetical protein